MAWGSRLLWATRSLFWRAFSLRRTAGVCPSFCDLWVNTQCFRTLLLQLGITFEWFLVEWDLLSEKRALLTLWGRANVLPCTCFARSTACSSWFQSVKTASETMDLTSSKLWRSFLYQWRWFHHPKLLKNTYMWWRKISKQQPDRRQTLHWLANALAIS